MKAERRSVGMGGGAVEEDLLEQTIMIHVHGMS